MSIDDGLSYFRNANESYLHGVMTNDAMQIIAYKLILETDNFILEKEVSFVNKVLLYWTCIKNK